MAARSRRVRGEAARRVRALEAEVARLREAAARAAMVAALAIEALREDTERRRRALEEGPEVPA